MEQAVVAAEAANDDAVTPEEVREYRAIRPELLQMLAEWRVLRGPNGCPAMRHILAPK